MNIVEKNKKISQRPVKSRLQYSTKYYYHWWSQFVGEKVEWKEGMFKLIKIGKMPYSFMKM